MFSCDNAQPPEETIVAAPPLTKKAPAIMPTTTLVASFKGQQVTGVSVSTTGRIFANFPRWHETVKHSVVEVQENGTAVPYPNAAWNSWKVGDPTTNKAFVAVQSVVVNEDKLYVLDTRNALWKGVIDAPRIFVFDLTNNVLEEVLVLDKEAYLPNSYTNDLRIDHNNKAIFITDSNEGAIIVYDLQTKKSKRVLDKHPSTQATLEQLTIEGKKWGQKQVHVDGIALHPANNRLYYHSLMGYELYSVSTTTLLQGSTEEIAASVQKEAQTGAPDGMVFDQKGYLFLANLETNSIQYLTPDKELKTLLQGALVKWADTFSIHEGYLYYTNSRINEVEGAVNNMHFSIYKVKL